MRMQMFRYMGCCGPIIPRCLFWLVMHAVYVVWLQPPAVSVNIQPSCSVHEATAESIERCRRSMTAFDDGGAGELGICVTILFVQAVRFWSQFLDCQTRRGWPLSMNRCWPRPHAFLAFLL